MNNPVDSFVAALERISELDADERSALVAAAEQWTRGNAATDIPADALDAILNALINHDARRLAEQSPELLAALLELVWRGCQSIAATSRARDDRAWPEAPDLVPEIATLYQHLDPDSPLRVQLLKSLVEIGNDEALEQFAELVVLDPPAGDEQAVLAFAPLFQRPNQAAGVLFPRLFDGLSHVQAAAPILDLANHLYRTKIIDRHPASEHVQALASLLGQVVHELERVMEKNPLTDPALTAEQLKANAEKVAAGSALVVALCDALGGIGNRDVVGSLYNALDLPHRRIKTEAAAALARLGQPTGDEALRQLAEEPAARFRALAYLEELDRVELVGEEFRSPRARAEGELALWLADPTQFGLPPAEMGLLDETTQYWPGFESPQHCYLFRFTYRLKQRELHGVGIAGPLVYAVSRDLNDLPPADIYALYAGWQAEHEEITERAVAALTDEEQQAVRQQLETAAANQYESLQPVTVALFLGELHVIASGSRGGISGVLVLDAGQLHWFPQPPTRRPLGPTEVYWLYKGRKLLKAFNRGDGSASG